MSTWLYIEDQPIAPLIHLERQPDKSSGAIHFQLHALLLDDYTTIQREVTLACDDTDEQRLVRCTRAWVEQQILHIEGIDLGSTSPAPTDLYADDWLIVDGKAHSQIQCLRMNEHCPIHADHCVFQISHEQWRQLRHRYCQKSGCQHYVALNQTEPTPPPKTMDVKVEIVRLRERLHLQIDVFGANWQPTQIVVLARITQAKPIGKPVLN